MKKSRLENTFVTLKKTLRMILILAFFTFQPLWAFAGSSNLDFNALINDAGKEKKQVEKSRRKQIEIEQQKIKAFNKKKLTKPLIVKGHEPTEIQSKLALDHHQKKIEGKLKGPQQDLEKELAEIGE